MTNDITPATDQARPPSTFTRAFAPGLILGVIAGLFAGVFISPFLGRTHTPPRRPAVASIASLHTQDPPRADALPRSP